MKIKANHKYMTENGTIVKIIYTCHGAGYPHVGHVVHRDKRRKKTYLSWSDYGDSYGYVDLRLVSVLPKNCKASSTKKA